MKSLILDSVDRNTLRGHAREVRLTAARLERHLLQNITDEAAMRYLSEMRGLIDVMEARFDGASTYDEKGGRR